MKTYCINYTDSFALMGEKTLRHEYDVKGNHEDFPTFEMWLNEGLKLGIIEDLTGKVNK